MATYKVLQDIEAEDKLLGPLTLKQFIFAIITIGIGFINFKLATTTGLSIVRWPFVIVFSIPMIVFGFLAAPISRDQPNDIWLLARLRFLIRPHNRIWNQTGISNLVSITVPKRVEITLTDGLSQNEVKSRLNALANTLDSRGWAVKNVNTNLYSQPDYVSSVDSDRLVAPSSLPQDVPAIDIAAADDILDTNANTTAHHLDQMIQASTAAHRQSAITSMAPADGSQQTPADYWFVNEPATDAKKQEPIAPDYTMFNTQQLVAPGSVDNEYAAATPITEADNALLNKIHHDQAVAQPVYGHLRNVQPLHNKEGQPVQQAAAPSLSAPYSQDNNGVGQNNPQNSVNTPNPAIIGLAQNDDLNVSTIAREAEKIADNDDEVVISLH